MRLNPFCPDVMYEDKGVIYFCLENYSEALINFGKVKSPTVKTLFYSAAALEKAGDKENARRLLSLACSQSGQPVEEFGDIKRYQSDSHCDHLRSSLMAIEI